MIKLLFNMCPIIIEFFYYGNMRTPYLFINLYLYFHRSTEGVSQHIVTYVIISIH